VYAQSQVVFTLRLYVDVATGRATLTAPETTGVEAIVEKLGEDTEYKAQRGNRDYGVRERRYAVFPQEPGKLTIGPVTYEAMVIPDRGFSRVQRFRSDVVELTVQPAVAPPAALAGAAWLPAQQIELTEDWSDSGDELAVGIPRTRTIVVSGLGLLETQLPDLPIEPQAGIRQYADQPEFSREITSRGLLSRRKVSLAVIAQSPGEITLGGVRLPWWNVTEQRWETAELPPRTLRVTPSVEAAAPEPTAAPAPAAEPTLADERSYWPIVSGVLALAWLATAALWWRARQDSARPRKRIRGRRSRGRAACVARVRRSALPERATAESWRARGSVAGSRGARGAGARGAHLRCNRRRLAQRRAQGRVARDRTVRNGWRPRHA
jgi:hypothetical protein